MKKRRSKFSALKRIGLLTGFLILIVPLSSALAASPKVKVMTRNLYLGGDIFKVVEAAQNPDPSAIPNAVAEIFRTVLYTNFQARAEAIADEIAKSKPDLIGLQEVSTFYKQTPGDSFLPTPTPATDVVIDFYEVLNNALVARGLYYTAYTTTNADVEVPMADPEAGAPYYLSDVRMVDHDVILVKTGHDSQEVLLDNYTWNLFLDIAGSTVYFTRGFGVVDVNIKGTPFRFVNTHLEVASSEGSVFRFFQSVQMQELLGILDTLAALDPEPVPLIMVGDFNSSPEHLPGTALVPGLGEMPYVPPYLLATDSSYMLSINPDYSGREYADTWLLQEKPKKFKYQPTATQEAGGFGQTISLIYNFFNQLLTYTTYTSGFEEEINDPEDTLESRIDLVFLNAGDLELKKSQCEVVGNEPIDMVENLPDHPGEYLWPSDHAGVVAELMLK